MNRYALDRYSLFLVIFAFFTYMDAPRTQIMSEGFRAWATLILFAGSFVFYVFVTEKHADGEK